MDFDTAMADSKDSAMKDVANHLNKPEALDRLDQYKRKISKKKTTIESQLRNAVQTQLDGVQKGLQTLQELEKTVREVRRTMSDVDTLYQDCAELSDVVNPIKEVNRKHQQLKTTTIHINNIFSVPDVVKETQELVQEGRLLEAHRNLAELEHTRDELFIQLYQSEDAFVDKNTSLHHYFEPLNSLSDALGQQLWLTMTKVSVLVMDSPVQVVTALRIIEREEKTDAIIEEALQVRGIPRSQLPGRPKRWREKCFEILETSISNKFDELEPSEEEKLENKGWLQDHLVSVASFMYSDLQAIKENGIPCFPPDYKILDFFIKCHHSILVKQISKLVSGNLNARDIIPLLIWIGDVRDSFQETLEVDFLKHGALIDPETEIKLQGRCQKQVEDNVQGLVNKMVETEVEDMKAFQPPEVDMDNHYYTTVGITLFQMVEQNISALSPLGMMNKLKILSICLTSIEQFLGYYKGALEDYHKKHLALEEYHKKHADSQRKELPFYILYMIAAANNCRSCIEFAEQLKQRFRVETAQNSLDAEHESAFKKISETFEVLAHYCCDCLVETAFMDLSPVFNEMFHKDPWFSHPGTSVGKVEATLVDYNEDFKFLKQAYHSYVMIECQHKVMYNYLQAMLSKRMVFKKDKEREKGTMLIKEDAKRISTFFLRLSHATNPKYTEVVEELASLLSASNDLLSLDVAGMANKHPDVRANHVVALLAMRGDMNRSLVQKVVQQAGLKEQQPDEVKPVPPAQMKTAASTRKKQEEKMLFQSLLIPNPYSMVGK